MHWQISSAASACSMHHTMASPIFSLSGTNCRIMDSSRPLCLLRNVRDIGISKESFRKGWYHITSFLHKGTHEGKEMKERWRKEDWGGLEEPNKQGKVKGRLEGKNTQSEWELKKREGHAGKRQLKEKMKGVRYSQSCKECRIQRRSLIFRDTLDALNRKLDWHLTHVSQ